ALPAPHRFGVLPKRISMDARSRTPFISPILFLALSLMTLASACGGRRGSRSSADAGMTGDPDSSMVALDGGVETDSGGDGGGTDAGCPDDDGDSVCNAADVCESSDDLLDSDGDGVPDGCDLCSGLSPSI